MGDLIPPAPPISSSPSPSSQSNPSAAPSSTASPSKQPIPITILTGFLGAGKTTLILNLVPQLRALNPSYTLALLKNELGDLAIDSQLASSSSISSVKEMLGGCVCCNLVGSLSSGLAELRESTPDLDRIIIETSGSAFPATLAMEINRIVRETKGEYTLDGVVSVIDVENWRGYEDTSVTAKLQAKYTDLVVLNKWEGVSERRLDEVLDRLGDLDGVDTPRVKSDRGRVDVDVVFGLDGGLLARQLGEGGHGQHDHDHEHGHGHGDAKKGEHEKEVDVLSVELKAGSNNKGQGVVDTEKLLKLLRSAPRDEVYRIKAVFTAAASGEGLVNSDEAVLVKGVGEGKNRFILNWAFGRWTFTPMGEQTEEHESSNEAILRMTIILAPYESTKWKKKLDAGGLVELEGEEKGGLVVKKIN